MSQRLLCREIKVTIYLGFHTPRAVGGQHYKELQTCIVQAVWILASYIVNIHNTPALLLYQINILSADKQQDLRRLISLMLRLLPPYTYSNIFVLLFSQMPLIISFYFVCTAIILLTSCLTQHFELLSQYTGYYPIVP